MPEEAAPASNGPQPDIYDAGYVRDLFDRVSSTYGYTNYIASFGFTERWRKQCVESLGELPSAAVGFDLMCGRGETWNQLYGRHGRIASLTGLDISHEMIKGASVQAKRNGAGGIRLLEQDMFANTIESASADFVISTFGLKTFTTAQLAALAVELERILKPGGRFSLIEVSEPKGWLLRPLYMFYLQRVMPIVEKLFLGYSYGFGMIGVYVASFGDCQALHRCLEAQGLRSTFKRRFFGCATQVAGFKES